MSSTSGATTSLVAASLAPTSTASQSAAMENAWAAPLPRTYFVGGFRVEHHRDSLGHSSWSCDCSEFSQSVLAGGLADGRADGQSGCAHTQRVTAAAELDQLLRTPGLILPTACY